MAELTDTALWDAFMQYHLTPRGERTALAQQLAAGLGVSYQTLHAKWAAAGWKRQRKQRADTGQSVVPPESSRMFAAAALATTRGNGKQLGSAETFRQMLQANGVAGLDVTAGHLLRLARARGHHPRQLAAPTPHVRLRALYPNHVHEFDASVCVQVYLRDGGTVVMPEIEFNKNKPANWTRIGDRRVLRFMLSDRYSATRQSYYTTGAETGANSVAALIEFWRDKGDPYLPCGVPELLYMDKGPGNVSPELLALCAALDVELIYHETGRARAKGGVEGAMNAKERLFEFQLLIEPGTSIENINDRARAEDRYFNYRTPLVRDDGAKRCRIDLWQARVEGAPALRVPADVEALRAIANSRTETRVINGELAISFAFRGRPAQQYRLHGVPFVRIGEKVEVVVNVFGAPGEIRVRAVDPATGKWCPHWSTVQPRRFDAAGQPLDAIVFGEGYRAAADTDVDRERKEVLRLTYGADTLEEAEEALRKRARPLAGIDPAAHIAATEFPARIGRAAELIDVDRPRVETPVETAIVVRRIKAALGHRFDGRRVWEHIERFHAHGVLESQIENLIAEFAREEAAAPNDRAAAEHAPLRAVGGGQ